jgi:hypothetical protein
MLAFCNWLQIMIIGGRMQAVFAQVVDENDEKRE